MPSFLSSRSTTAPRSASARLRAALQRLGRVVAMVYVAALALVALAVGITSMASGASAAEIRVITWPIAPDHLDNVDPWSDTYGAPRSGGRVHLGVDICGPKMTPLVAAASGEVTWMRHGGSGNNLTITDADGWKYHYVHINNDTPGTDDGANGFEHAFAPGIERGAQVDAGQVVAYLGDSGNAESTCPHLHFEIEKPNGAYINPTPSVDVAASAIRDGGVDPDLGLEDYPSMSAFAADALSTLGGIDPSSAAIDDFRAEVNAKGVAGALEPFVGPDSVAAGVDRLYYATFLRLPDAQGYQYWIDQEAGDWNIADISQFFATSDEFKARFGDKDYGALLDQIYREMFGREPDPDGRDYWLERLADPSDPVTPGTVLSYFSDGDEAKIVAGTRSEFVGLVALFEDRMPSNEEIAEWQELRMSVSFEDAVVDRFLS